jgi:hypothetical protein
MDPYLSECPWCAAGLPHPARTVLTVRGSRMRHGGQYHAGDLTIGTDKWVRVRCDHCGLEAMTPAESVDDLDAARHHDGVYRTACQACTESIIRTGHARTTRRRRRHG